MPGSRVFKKPTYLNIYGSSRHQHNSQRVIQWEPRIDNNSWSQRKVSVSSVVSATVMLLWVSEMFFFLWGLCHCLPVLVKGLENSCCKSLFSDVRRTTTMSAGRVSLFFSRKPFTLYSTCGAGHTLHPPSHIYIEINTAASFFRCVVHSEGHGLLQLDTAKSQRSNKQDNKS